MSDTAVTVIGNIAKEPEAKITKTGAHIVSLVVASSRSKKTEDGWAQAETSYFDVELWDSMAMNANVTLRKGMSVIVHGHIKTDSWEQSGQTRYRQKLVPKAIGPTLKWQRARVVRTNNGRSFDEAPSQWKHLGSEISEPLSDENFASNADGSGFARADHVHDVLERAEQRNSEKSELVGAGVSAMTGGADATELSTSGDAVSAVADTESEAPF